MSDPFLSVVIPVYNEQARIGPTLIQVLQYINSQPFKTELIVVDDGSTDRTLDVVHKNLSSMDAVILRNEVNSGKGSAVKKGMLAASGKYVLFSDADLSTPIHEVSRFIAVLDKGGFDVVIGSRALDNSMIEIHQNWLRELMGKIFNKIARLLSFHGIQDSQCGFKAFNQKSARDLFSAQKINGFAFDAEILYLAQKKGYLIKEEPVVWRNSDQSRVSILKDPLMMFWDLIKIRWMHRETR